MSGSERNKPCRCGSGVKAKRCPCGTAVRRIVKHDHPALNTVSEPIGRGDDISFIATMKLACKSAGNGVGLAANQIGVTKRAVWICADRISGFIMLNPVIVWRSDTTRTESEGCLSYPGVFAQVKRHDEIEVEFENHNRIPLREKFIGYEARIIQHEIDHLDGVCLVGDEWRRQRDLERQKRNTAMAGIGAMMMLASGAASPRPRAEA